jgi:peptidoglycan/LPS O-acetylase OafA/YrhL
MAYVGVVAIVFAVIVALYTASMLAPRLHMEAPVGRHAPIDGLRGFAALFVFFCHSALWLYFAKTGRWANAPVPVYGNLGLGGVVMFFMITAYLFGSKLLKARESGIDWLRLFVSRVLRLTPLYLFALAVMLVVIAASTGFEWNEQADSWTSSLAKWLAFAIWGTPDLNGMHDTWMVTAGVTWSLRYEWAFYLLLPLFAVVLRIRASWLLVLPTALLAAQIAFSSLKLQLATPFLGGALAAWLVTIPRFRELAIHRHACAAAMVALVVAAAFFRSPFKAVPLVLITGAFVVIAGGNTLYGILSSRPARLLGEVSYSMYLLHGIVLFILAHGVIGLDVLAGMSPWLYWTIIVALTPLLVGLCMLTFILIERPAMRSVDRMTARFRVAGRVAKLSP